MKVLDFTIVEQTIKREPRCDFSGLVAGSRGYLHARFHFSDDWARCNKVVVFSGNGKDYPVPLVHNMCEIPAEALTGTTVKVRVIGRRPGYEICTGTVTFSQSLSH